MPDRNVGELRVESASLWRNLYWWVDPRHDQVHAHHPDWLERELPE